MHEPQRQLTMDEAMAEFQALAREQMHCFPSRPGSEPSTPQEAEDLCFRFAESILGLACPDPRACTDQRCRRDALCRHFERVRAKRASGKSVHPRRTPGAEAVRYAIWVYMNAGR